SFPAPTPRRRSTLERRWCRSIRDSSTADRSWSRKSRGRSRNVRRLRRFLAELLLERVHHAHERAVDQRLGLDQPRAVLAEPIGELVGRERDRLLPLAVGEQIGAAKRADPSELGKRELSVLALELDPHPALEAGGKLREAILNDFDRGLDRLGRR